jgi:hypothetical protein
LGGGMGGGVEGMSGVGGGGGGGGGRSWVDLLVRCSLFLVVSLDVLLTGLFVVSVSSFQPSLAWFNIRCM